MSYMSNTIFYKLRCVKTPGQRKNAKIEIIGFILHFLHFLFR